MAYQRELEVAAYWLASSSNADHGWGMTPDQASSLVNTSEAIFVLENSKTDYDREIANGIQYIKDNWAAHLDERGAKLRFVAFPLMLLKKVGLEERLGKRELKRMEDWIASQVNTDGGWGAIDGASSDVFSTFTAVQALCDTSLDDPTMLSARNWLVAAFRERAWGFDENSELSSSATAYALIALHQLNDGRREPTVDKGISYLLQTRQWSDEEQSLAGTMWKHCKHANVLAALALWEDDIFGRTIASGVLHSNHLINSEGGWNETAGSTDTRSVRSQYWASYYSQHLIEAFDPSKFVLRIDAERSEKTLKAPEFQHFFVGTERETILPTALMKTATYSLLAIGSLLALNVFVYNPEFLHRIDNFLGLTILAAAFIIVRSRPLAFGRISKIILGLVVLFGALNLMFGTTLIGSFDYISNFISDIIDRLKSTNDTDA